MLCILATNNLHYHFILSYPLKYNNFSPTTLPIKIFRGFFSCFARTDGKASNLKGNELMGKRKKKILPTNF